MIEPAPPCGREESSCRCGLEADHDGAHVCELPRCDGSWTYDESGQFTPLRLPGGGDAIFRAIFGGVPWEFDE